MCCGMTGKAHFWGWDLSDKKDPVKERAGEMRTGSRKQCKGSNKVQVGVFTV